MKVKGKYVAGRDIKIKIGRKKIKAKWSFWTGIGILCLMLIISFLIRNPTALQFLVFKAVLSIGIASLGASMVGFIQIKSNGFELGGGVIIFVLFYILTPDTMISGDRSNKRLSLVGYVYDVKEPIGEALVVIPEFNLSAMTNSNGVFNISYPNDSVNVPFSIHLYCCEMDTIIEVNNFPENSFLPIELCRN